MAELWEPLRARLEEYQAQGMRTLALAACNVPKGTEPFREGVVRLRFSRPENENRLCRRCFCHIKKPP